ncbi:hypothetical protein L226DRAFT_577046, partial [Lentinus tigrinus ALCF2SS1-7]|uniref:uncharacterized protein n=1 Tax=Lentinus tigrinus ALCF2SS1-7 TaxID=1328758 RepID=UPI001165EF27
FAGDTPEERARDTELCENAKKETVFREHYSGYICVVLWYLNGQRPAILYVRLGASHTIALLEDERFSAISRRNGNPDEVDVWDRKNTDWVTCKVGVGIQVPEDDHTLLIRLPDLLALPLLGVEMEALYLEHELIAMDDPKVSSSKAVAQQAKPFGTRNVGKEDEVDIDLVAEQERDILSQLNNATVRVDNHNVIDVDDAPVGEHARTTGAGLNTDKERRQDDQMAGHSDERFSKSTGESAPRAKLAKRKAAPKPEVPDSEEETETPLAVSKRLKLHGPRGAFVITEDTHDQFCHLCHNGGDLLVCDECPRVACKAHFPEVLNLTAEALDDLYFRCLACHFHRAPQGKDEGKRKPYSGLYRKHEGALVPFRDEPLRVVAPAHRPPQSRVNTAPIVIVHIRLAEFADAGSPARAMHTVLDPYYRTTRPEKLVYIDAPYSFDTAEDASEFRKGLNKELSVLTKLPGARVMVFIFTHSEETSGDLFWKTGESSDSLEEWWGNVIPDRLMKAGANHEVNLAMLACGSLVQSTTQRDKLKHLAERMQVKRVIAFGASAVQACFTGSFFMSFATSVLIEGVVLDNTHLARLLDTSTLLARHTSVLIFARQRAGDDHLQVKEYTWSHKCIQPWGQVLPMQCPECGSIYSFVVKSAHDGHQHARCSIKGCSYVTIFTSMGPRSPSEENMWRDVKPVIKKGNKNKQETGGVPDVQEDRMAVKNDVPPGAYACRNTEACRKTALGRLCDEVRTFMNRVRQFVVRDPPKLLTLENQ